MSEENTKLYKVTQLRYSTPPRHHVKYFNDFESANTYYNVLKNNLNINEEAKLKLSRVYYNKNNELSC